MLLFECLDLEPLRLFSKTAHNQPDKSTSATVSLSTDESESDSSEFANTNEKHDILTALQESEIATECAVPPLPTVKWKKEVFEEHCRETKIAEPSVHYIFLVHGLMGNVREMSYLSRSLHMALSKNNIASSKPKNDSLCSTQGGSGQHENSFDDLVVGKYPKVIIHSVERNVGKTNDGIRNGGVRLADEIIDFIRSDFMQRQNDESISMENNNNEKHVTYSIVGNSLGGLYARCALAFIPNQLHLTKHSQPQKTHEERVKLKTSITLNLHSNVFCTIGAPNLGMAGYNYLRLPRSGEALVAKGMGVTGNDLFMFKSKKPPSCDSLGPIKFAENYCSYHGIDFPKNDINDDPIPDGKAERRLNDTDKCIMRSLCLHPEYLGPLSNFRHRIAYANACGTDCLAPPNTAAFLHDQSDVCHEVLAMRRRQQSKNCAVNRRANRMPFSLLSPQGYDIYLEENEGEVEWEEAPFFVVAKLRTQRESNVLQSQSQMYTQSKQPENRAQPTRSRHQMKSNDLLNRSELLAMSKSLDALGWTKILLDVRNFIPLPRIRKPLGLPFSSSKTLDDLIDERGHNAMVTKSLESALLDSTTPDKSIEVSINFRIEKKRCIVKSREVAKVVTVGDAIPIPLGHTILVANTKNKAYSKFNMGGRPLVDYIARDVIDKVLGFERFC